MLADLGQPVGILGRLPHVGVALDHGAFIPAQRAGVGAFGVALSLVAGKVVRLVGFGQFGHVDLRQRAAGIGDYHHGQSVQPSSHRVAPLWSWLLRRRGLREMTRSNPSHTTIPLPTGLMVNSTDTGSLPDRRWWSRCQLRRCKIRRQHEQRLDADLPVVDAVAAGVVAHDVEQFDAEHL